jgi:hypothetical protein
LSDSPVSNVSDTLRWIAAYRAPMKFAPSNGVAYFEALGWNVAAVHSTLHAAARYRRLPFLLRIFARFGEPDTRKPGQWRWYGVVKLKRP